MVLILISGCRPTSSDLEGSLVSNVNEAILGLNYSWFSRQGACNPNINNAADTSGCVQKYQKDMDKAAGLGVKYVRIYQQNRALITAAKKTGLKVLVGTYTDDVANLASDGSSCLRFGKYDAKVCGVLYGKQMLNGNTTPVFFSKLFDFIKDGTIVGIILGNEVNSVGDSNLFVDPATVEKAAANLKTAMGQVGAVTDIIITLREGPTTGTNSYQQYCSSSSIDRVGIDLYCTNVAALTPIYKSAPECVTNIKKAGGGATIDKLWFDFKGICSSKKPFIAESGWPTESATDTTPRSNESSYLENLRSWACNKGVETYYFEMFDERGKNFGLYTSDGTQKVTNANALFSCGTQR